MLAGAASFDLEESDGSIRRRTLRALLNMVCREVVLKLLAFMGWIVLARMLDPGTFGLFAISSFAVNLFVVVSEVGLGAAFVRQEKVSSHQLNALFSYQLAWALLVGILAIVIASPVAALLGLPEPGLLVQALSLSFIIVSLRTVPCIISQRNLAYGPMVLSDVAAQIAYWAAALAAAAAGLGMWSAVAAVMSFAVIGTLVLYMRVGWMPALSLDWAEAHSKVRFSLMYQGQQGASLLKFAMLPILGGIAAGSDGVGYVTWAHQIAVVPIQLTQLVSRVSYPALARLQHRSEAFADLSRTALKWTCRLTFPACALLVGLGPQLVTYVYGPTWTPALPSLYLFAINIAINAPVGVLMPALYSLDRGARAFRIVVGMLVITWVAGLLLARGAGLQAPALGFIAGMLASLAAVLYELRDLAGMDTRSLSFVRQCIRALSLLRPIWLPAASAIAGAVLLQLVAPVVVHSLVSLAAVVIVAGVLMLLVNMWGEYESAARMVKSFVARLSVRGLPGTMATEENSTPLQSPSEERQDVRLGSP